MPEVQHGTPAQYQREMRQAGQACSECQEANRENVRAWRIRTGRTRSLSLPMVILRQIVTAPTEEERERALVKLVGQPVADAILGRPDTVIPAGCEQ